MRRSTNKISLIMEVNPGSPVAEAYRSLRTNLGFASLEKELKSIAITSAHPKEGKTTTAANLAIAFAHIGKEVLLIDADLRKPVLHTVFNKHNRGGLTSVIVNQQNLKQAVQETHIEHLSLLPSGPLPPNASELLASSRFSALLEECKEKYDVILIDTPPALTITDAHVVSSKCDGVLLVANAGKVKREAIAQVKTALSLVKANVIGAILNNVKEKKEDKKALSYIQESARAMK